MEVCAKGPTGNRSLVSNCMSRLENTLRRLADKPEKDEEKKCTCGKGRHPGPAHDVSCALYEPPRVYPEGGGTNW